jgi:hypothetical protein
MGWDDYERGKLGAAWQPAAAPVDETLKTPDRVPLPANYAELSAAEKAVALEAAGVGCEALPGWPSDSPQGPDAASVTALQRREPISLQEAAKERLREEKSQRKQAEKAKAAVGFPAPLRCEWATELAGLLSSARWPTLEVYVGRPDPKSDTGGTKSKKVGRGWFASVFDPDHVADCGESHRSRDLFVLLRHGDVYSAQQYISGQTALAGQATDYQLEAWRPHAEAVATDVLRRRRRLGRPKDAWGQVWGDSAHF